MKIVCENCGAKYSIADEKVKGKVFKIRCKKCNESILVRGDDNLAAVESELAPAPTPAASAHSQGRDDDLEAETRVFDYGGYHHGSEAEAIWHIVVDDQQQGPYTEAQIKEYLQTGSLMSDGLIWKEGFDDWMTISEVPEFAKAQPAPSSGVGRGVFDDQPKVQGGLFDDQPGGGLFSGETAAASPFDSGGGLFSSAAASASIGGDVFSSATAEPADGGLFGRNSGKSAALFSKKEPSTADEGIFSSTKEQPVLSAVQSPRVSAEQAMMTGQRNENSVLFSLSNLQALASGPPKEKEAPAKAVGFASAVGGEEASGLIDIRALAGSLSSTESQNTVDDFISMGGGGFSPALGAPVLSAQNEGMSNTVKFAIIGGAVALLALIVVVLVVVLSGDNEAQTAAQEQIMALQKQIEELSKKGTTIENAETLAALQAQLKEKQNEASGKPSASSSSAGASSTSESSKTEDDKKASASSGGSKTKRTGKTGGASESESSSSGGSSSSSSAATPSPTPKTPSKTTELDDLLGGSGPSKPKQPSTTPSAGGGLAPTPKDSLAREDVQRGMEAVASAVKSCGQGRGGTITMNVVIGTTGRVTSAAATGNFAGTPIGTCAANAVRRAKFPASKQSLNVKYPFKL